MTPPKLSFLEVPEQGQGLSNLYLTTDLGIVDFISSITGVGDFARVESQAETVMIDGHAIKIISLEDLIRAKESLGRDKDKLAAMELKAILAKKN